MSQHEPQHADPKPTDESVGAGRWIGALALAAGLLLAPTARADTAGQSAKQASPLAEERAAKEAEAASKGAPDPALVPDPPEQIPGRPSDAETLIELPIAPAGTRPDESGEPEEALAPVPATSEDTAAVIDEADELQRLRVLFPQGGIAIDADAESELIGLAGFLSANQAQRVVLQAYAGGDNQGGSDARRLSLSRALAIRSFLVDRGVAVERVHLRPLGSEIEDGPADRVDILPLRP